VDTQDDTQDLELTRYDDEWGPDDPYADLKADVTAYGHADPLVTLRGLSDASGIPVGALARYVLARWASGGNEAKLELGTSGVDHLARAVEDAEAAGSDEAKLDAYERMRELVRWLRADPDLAGPGDAT
jgi:hypothetical protein